MDVLAGTSASVRINFEGPDGLMIPDPGTTVYRLYGQDGTDLLYDLPVNPAANATGAELFIPQTHHFITGTRRFERRILYVRWVTGGQSFSTRVTYRVVPLTFYTASAENVRTFFGLNSDELTDEEVDIFAAFLTVEEQLTRPVLDLALTSGTTDEIYANRAIVAEAGLAVLPSIILRAVAATSEGSNKFARFKSGPDVEQLRSDLTAMSTAAFEAIVPTQATATSGGVVAFSVPTDAVTGA